MDNNPIMQRVLMLSEMWASELANQPDARVFCWQCTSNVEYKTIKGFVMFQTSSEKTLEDTVLYMSHAYEPATKNYAQSILTDMHKYFIAWNSDDDMIAQTGKIEWEPAIKKADENEAAYFLKNLSSLANALSITGDPGVLAMALFPNAISDIKEFGAYIENLIREGIPPNIRFMLYDNYDMNTFEKIAEHFPGTFKYLQPDLDIPGAMNQILEDAKNTKTSEEEKDIISYQQALIKMNEAIGYSNEKDIMFYKNNCLSICSKHKWPQQEALVYFFLQNYYASINDNEKAHKAIDKAIHITDTAYAGKQIEDNQTQYQYYIAKGNLFFIHKQFEKAADVYKKSLELDRTMANPLMLAGIHQMLGNSLRQYASKKEARSCFKTGWQLLLEEDEATLKTNAIAMFYANDMLAVADDEILENYAPAMDQWWGEGWQRNLRKEQYLQTQMNNHE